MTSPQEWRALAHQSEPHNLPLGGGRAARVVSIGFVAGLAPFRQTQGPGTVIGFCTQTGTRLEMPGIGSTSLRGGFAFMAPAGCELSGGGAAIAMEVSPGSGCHQLAGPLHQWPGEPADEWGICRRLLRPLVAGAPALNWLRVVAWSGTCMSHGSATVLAVLGGSGVALAPEADAHLAQLEPATMWVVPADTPFRLHPKGPQMDLLWFAPRSCRPAGHDGAWEPQGPLAGHA